MEYLKHYQIISELQSGKISPVYIFLGEEDFLKQEAIKIIKKQIFKSDFEISFNYNHFYVSELETKKTEDPSKKGEDPVKKIIETAETYPVFGEKRLVVVDEIERLKKLEHLNAYIKNPANFTCLVLITEKREIPANLNINPQKCVVAIFYTLFENEIYRWITKRVSEENKLITAEAIERLIEFCNNSLSEINHEIEKLVLYTGDRNKITLSDVMQITGDTKKFNVFVLSDELGKKNFVGAIKIFRRMKNMGTDINFIFSMINSFFHQLWKIYYYKSINNLQEIVEKMHPRSVRRFLSCLNNFSQSHLNKIIILLDEYEKKLKTESIVPKEVLIEDLIYKICFS